MPRSSQDSRLQISMRHAAICKVFVQIALASASVCTWPSDHWMWWLISM